jgi:PAS domain S-box-containing protein
MGIGLSIYSWRRRRVPGALPFTIGVVFGVAWGVASIMEQAAVDAATKIFWFRAQYALHLPAVTATTCFVLDYAAPGRWLNRRRVALLAIPPLLFAAAVLTDPSLHLAWLDIAYDLSRMPQRGPANWAGVAYGYGLGFLNIAILGWLFVRVPQQRLPVAIMLTGQVTGRVLYAVQAAGGGWYPIRLDLVALAIPSVMYAIALFGFRIFSPIGLAQQAVLAQMRDGVLVLDAESRVVELNPAAQQILGSSERRAIGSPIRDLLPSYEQMREVPNAMEAGETEISLEMQAQTRYYAPAVSPLKDWRGLAVGRLLLLHDVTEQRRAQAQALQQMWAEATLQERALLAQELHDGLAQSLGFLNLQAQAAQIYLQRGRTEAAQESLDRLAQGALEVQDDTRDLIDNLLAFSAPSLSLCSAIRQAVARFSEQSGHPVRLEIPDDLEAICNPEALGPAAGVQILRIVQEALTNVRKHAGSPTRVDVALHAKADHLMLAIADDGAGFDPSVPGTGGKHYGLQVMRQRAERIGGRLTVRSAPGQGTRVEVCMPLATGRPGAGNPMGAANAEV